MADKRRMNVALTRAKYALYIIAHLESLRVGLFVVCVCVCMWVCAYVGVFM